MELLADRRDREVEHRQIHHVEQAREREDGEADPFAPAGSAGLLVRLDRDGGRGGHLGILLVVSMVVTASGPKSHRSCVRQGGGAGR
jgi:hypothetical protein